MVVIYEDVLTGRRGKHFNDKLIQQLGEECDFKLELGHDPWAELARDWRKRSERQRRRRLKSF